MTEVEQLDDMTTPRLVVGVGASAGGLEAFKKLLSVLPHDAGMTYLLVQHLDPNHKSLLKELLAPHTRMNVIEASQGMKLERDTVYIIRPDTALAVGDQKIELSEPKLHRGVRLPVDHLFRSLAHEYGSNSVGIILSGAGSDGSSGFRDIKGVGGLTIAQEPKSSAQSGMPQSAINTGFVDLVLPIDAIPEALDRFVRLPKSARVEPAYEKVDSDGRHEPTRNLTEAELSSLAALLEAQLDFDLRVYKAGTIERRVLRRMALSGYDQVDVYYDFLRNDVSEQNTLIRDLLISVTDFFRDPDAYRELRKLVVNPLVREASANSTIRVWVPGCASGEEPYSMAMEFLDSIKRHGKRISVQIFATDIDQDALAVARMGLYPVTIEDHISKQRLNEYFRQIDGHGYQVRPRLRDTVSFAVHDLTKDPPFSRMNLVSCRNVLIYLTSKAQHHVLKVMHFALQSNGFLFMSTSESTASQKELFSTISKTWRIYQKIGPSRPIHLERTNSIYLKEKPGHINTAANENATIQASDSYDNEGGVDLARRELLRSWAPPTIVVAYNGSIIYMHGELSPFLHFPEGNNPKLELNGVLRPEYNTRAKGAIYKCRRDNKKVVALSSLDKGNKKRVRITANPALTLGDGTVILSFEILEKKYNLKDVADSDEVKGQETMIEQLEKELQATREDLRNTVEELETSNEELRSSNEESMSMNEELQSANEELEATTEELRSLNEELTTVNTQLREKIEQLEQAHDDLNNFFSSTKIATLFLDINLRIKRFTPAAASMLKLDESDVGRYVSDIARELLHDELDNEAHEVLEHLTNITRELHTQAGKWISRQILPYRTEARRIEGVVVTFTDITDLKLTATQLEMREHQQAVIARMGMQALKETDINSFMEQIVRDVQKVLDTDFCKILEIQPGGDRLLLRAGVGWKSGLVGNTYVSAGNGSQAGYTIHARDAVIVEDLAKEKRFSGPSLLTDHNVVSGMSCVIRDDEIIYGAIGAHTKNKVQFQYEDTNFLQATANIIGSAINRHQVKLRMVIERAVAQILTGVADDQSTFESIFRAFTDELPISVGEVWEIDSEKTALSRSYLFVAPGVDKDEYEKRFKIQSFKEGKGVVGKVYQKNTAVWLTDMGDSDMFEERVDDRDAGILSAIAFPVYTRDKTTGVIILFSHERMYFNDDFLHSLESIGYAIGSFLQQHDLKVKLLRLAAITQSTHDAILSYDFDGIITEWLSGAELLYGYTADEMIGSSINLFVPEEYREELWEVNSRIKSGEVIDPYETQRLCKDGTILDISVRSSPLFDINNNIIGITANDRDITRQKKTERMLKLADQQKDEFLAMLGHELRNPLAGIRTASEIINLHIADYPDLKKTQSVLDRQSSHMAKILDGLLDVSRIIRGKIELELDIVDLVSVCREVSSDMAGKIDENNIDFVMHLPDQPVWIEADRIRLTQVIDNLLTNAIKYNNENGSMTLSIQLEGETAILVVSDTGVGIEPELLDHVFDIFRQSKQNLDRSTGGMGIGLALVKSLVQLHGGSISVQSDGKDKGARFTVILPLTEAPPKCEKTSTERVYSKRRILVIEDNMDSAETLKMLLEDIGHEVTFTCDGKQGVELARDCMPDVILCDIGLPNGMTGHDVARSLREDSRTQSIRLIALSGYGRPEDKQKSMASGFDAHINKPASLDTLAHYISDDDTE